MLSLTLKRDCKLTGYHDSPGPNALLWAKTSELSELFAGVTRAEGRTIRFQTFKKANETTYPFSVSTSLGRIIVGESRSALNISVSLCQWFREQHKKGYTHVCLWLTS